MGVVNHGVKMSKEDTIVVVSENIRVEEYYDPRLQRTSILILERDGKDTYSLQVARQKVELNEAIEPCFILEGGYESGKDLLQMLINYAYDKYSLTPTRMKLEDNAQKYHLEDMRRLVFEKK